MPGTFNITNGDSTTPVLRAGGVRGEIVPWRDVLHDGPVPALPWPELRDVRADFIASRGWGSRGEALADFTRRDEALLRALEHGTPVVLWFEHDLYDQLQLVQVLAMAAPAIRDGAPVMIAQADDYLGTMPPEGVRALAGRMQRAGDEHVCMAVDAWEAFTAEDLGALQAFAHDQAEGDVEDGVLPYLRPALQRLLQEVPNEITGLSRTELQTLRVLAAGPRSRTATYVAAHHHAESPIWLGDWSYYALLDCLCDGSRPLVARDGELLSLTADGRAVLEGRAHRTSFCSYDRWIGGTHLVGCRKG